MDARRVEKHAPDYGILMLVLAMSVFGLLMVFSASMSEEQDPRYYFTHQLQWFLVGLVALAVAYRIDYRRWRQLAYVIFIGTGLVLVLMFFIGSVAGGARSFIGSSGSFQPSEIAKLAVILFCAEWLPRKGDDVRTWNYGLVPFGVLIGLIVGLIYRQPDLGTAMIVALIAGCLFVMAGADLVQSAMAGGAAGVVIYITSMSYQRDRIGRFWDPCAAEGARLDQVCQGITALGSGGVAGLGLGASRWRWVLFAPYSDSIFAIIGEELGLIGTIGVVVLFAVFAYRGFRVAMRSQDTFARMVAAGITLWVVIQAAVNLGGVVALVPFTGVPLPFISYGGSSLVTTMAGIGILLNISRFTVSVEGEARSPLLRVSHAATSHGRGNRGARVPSPVGRGSTEKRSANG